MVGSSGARVMCACGTTWYMPETGDAPPVVSHREAQPGNKIRAYLQSRGLVSRICMDCGRKAARLNAWGPEKCAERIDEIIRDIRKPHPETLREDLLSILRDAQT